MNKWTMTVLIALGLIWYVFGRGQEGSGRETGRCTRWQRGMCRARRRPLSGSHFVVMDEPIVRT
nr:hypothetical protein LVJ77_00570 [Conchiformibius kuhniae]